MLGISNGKSIIWCQVWTVCVSSLLLLLIGRASAEPLELQGIDNTVQQIQTRLKIPGISLAVVRGDQVLYTQGYGVRALNKKDRVDNQTLFALGSVSKAFTATALGLLVHERKLSWDDPLAKYLPDFSVADPYVSDQLSVRDALSHRTGLDPSNGLMMANPQMGRKTMLKRMQHLEQVRPFRAAYLYNNLMYIAVSELIPAITGDSWETQITNRLLTPLGMENSIANSGTQRHPRNTATPHASGEQGVYAIDYYDMTTAAPAGGILSSANDMGQWCRAQLQDGKVGGEQRIAAGIINTTHQGVIRANRPEEQDFDQGKMFSLYAMGWSQKDYRGQLMISHGGGIDGMSAYVSMLPQQDICVVTLSNLSPAASTHRGLFSLHNWIYDRFLDVEDKDWLAHLDQLLEMREQQQAKRAQRSGATRVAGTQPSHSVDAYLGTYRNVLQGDIVVSRNSNGLRMQYGEIYTGDLKHWHYNTFKFNFDAPGQPDITIQFFLDSEGNITAMGPGINDAFRFARVK